VLWFTAEAGTDVAVRFATSATSTFAKLSASAKIGSPLSSRNPTLSDLRKWRVDGFPKQLIFYQPVSDGIQVVRVLHAA